MWPLKSSCIRICILTSKSLAMVLGEEVGPDVAASWRSSCWDERECLVETDHSAPPPLHTYTHEISSPMWPLKSSCTRICILTSKSLAMVGEAGPEVAALSWRSSCSDQWFEKIDAISCNVCDSMRSMRWTSFSSVVEFAEDGRRVPKDASKASSEGNAALENRM
jgi:hypothetical protein